MATTETAMFEDELSCELKKANDETTNLSKAISAPKSKSSQGGVDTELFPKSLFQDADIKTGILTSTEALQSAIEHAENRDSAAAGVADAGAAPATRITLNISAGAAGLTECDLLDDDDTADGGLLRGGKKRTSTGANDDAGPSGKAKHPKTSGPNATGISNGGAGAGGRISGARSANAAPEDKAASLRNKARATENVNNLFGDQLRLLGSHSLKAVQDFKKVFEEFTVNIQLNAIDTVKSTKADALRVAWTKGQSALQSKAQETSHVFMITAELEDFVDAMCTVTKGNAAMILRPQSKGRTKKTHVGKRQKTDIEEMMVNPRPVCDAIAHLSSMFLDVYIEVRVRAHSFLVEFEAQAMDWGAVQGLVTRSHVAKSVEHSLAYLIETDLDDQYAMTIQQNDVRTVLIDCIKAKTEPNDMIACINHLPTSEFDTDLSEEVDTLSALLEPEKCGDARVTAALARIKGSQEGLYFHIRFQMHGQMLKRQAGAWLASQTSTSVVRVRVERALSHAIDLHAAIGVNGTTAFHLVDKLGHVAVTFSDVADDKRNADKVEDLRSILDSAFTALIKEMQDMLSTKLFAQCVHTVDDTPRMRDSMDDSEILAALGTWDKDVSKDLTRMYKVCVNSERLETIKSAYKGQRSIFEYMRLRNSSDKMTTELRDYALMTASMCDIAWPCIDNRPCPPDSLAKAGFSTFVEGDQCVIRNALVGVSSSHVQGANAIFVQLGLDTDDIQSVVRPSKDTTSKLHLAPTKVEQLQAHFDGFVTMLSLPDRFQDHVALVQQSSCSLTVCYASSLMHQMLKCLGKQDTILVDDAIAAARANIATVVAPTTDKEQRAAAIHKQVSGLNAVALLLRAYKKDLDRATRPVKELHCKQLTIPEGTLNATAAAASQTNRFCQGHMDAIVGAMSTTFADTTRRFIAEVRSLYMGTVGVINDALPKIDHAEKNLMDPWNEAELRSLALTPIMMSLGNYLTFGIRATELAKSVRDLDVNVLPEDEVNRWAQHTINKTRRASQIVTAIVGCTKAPAARNAFCAAAVASLRKQGVLDSKSADSKLPDALKTRLLASAEAPAEAAVAALGAAAAAPGAAAVPPTAATEEPMAV